MVLSLLVGCTAFRAYPLLTLDVAGRHPPLHPSGAAVLDDGHLVVVTHGEADRLYTPEPDVAVGGGGILEALPLHDGRQDCLRPDAPRNCSDTHFRATVRLRPEPVTWIPRDRRVTVPYDVEDLAAYAPDEILGVTNFSTVGRRTAFRKDDQARSRRQTERLFVLRHTPGGWVEVLLPEVERLRDALSDWGRGTCNEDMLVEGLAYDREHGTAYIGVSHCHGPAAKVLAYDLAGARLDRPADLEVVADGIAGRELGPAEGLTGLGWSDGRLWAVTSWDSYGYDTEAAFGGELLEVRDGRLAPQDVATRFVDRPTAVVALPGVADQSLVLFDNDLEAGATGRPNATLLRARTPRPPDRAWASLLDLQEEPDAPALALNGFDLRWYARDHRLSQVGAVLDELPGGGVGAWTRAVGGAWQMRVGATLGNWSAALRAGKRLGHDTQGVSYTDLRALPGLRVTGYRARVSVIPRDRERQNPRVAELLGAARDAYRVRVPLPATPDPGAVLVLQGFEVDTSSRAHEGICLAALDLGVDWADAGREAVALQATVIGGLCNDYDSRGPALLHGRTTAPDGGAEVTLRFAVLEGVEGRDWAARAYDRVVPHPPGVDAERATTDTIARAHLQCVRVDEAGVHPLPRQAGAAPLDWLDVAGGVAGDPRGPAGALREFALAIDPEGFDPALGPTVLGEREALGRNNYISRYLLRAFVDAGGLFLEGGLSHGIHKTGLMRDAARPSATLVAVEGTTFPAATGAVTYDSRHATRRDAPDVLPEDGFPRWAAGAPLTEPPACSPAW